ncbi:MAG: hypothetical protein JOZ62_03495 [Acidobacteriaceae bacterium]|nr:hypothetical protein [Acidobacteriaceae bacterium]
MKLLIILTILSTQAGFGATAYNNYNDWISAIYSSNENVSILTGFETSGVLIYTRSGPRGNHPGNGFLANGVFSDCHGKNACNDALYDYTFVTSPIGTTVGFAGDWSCYLSVRRDDSGLMELISKQCFGGASSFSGWCGVVLQSSPFVFGTDSGYAQMQWRNPVFAIQ